MAKRKVAVRLEGADPAQIIMPGVRPASLGARLAGWIPKPLTCLAPSSSIVA